MSKLDEICQQRSNDFFFLIFSKEHEYYFSNLIINMQFHQKKRWRQVLGVRILFFESYLPYYSLLENNKLGIISCSPFCSPKESSPQTAGVEGGGEGVSWKLYKFWSSSHSFLHSWTMQHYRKRPRNYGLIMVSILSAMCLIYFELY